jgi:hypothetical protein
MTAVAPPRPLPEDGNLVRHAIAELERAGFFDADADYGPELGVHLVELVRAFARGGHSGGSASVALMALDKLLNFEPLTPLTFAPDEWTEVGPGVWQNRRKSSVLSTDHGATWHDVNDDEPVGGEWPKHPGYAAAAPTAPPLVVPLEPVEVAPIVEPLPPVVE